MPLLFAWRIAQAVGGFFLWYALRDNNRLRNGIKTISANPVTKTITIRAPATPISSIALSPQISKHSVSGLQQVFGFFNEYLRLLSDQENSESITVPVHYAIFVILIFLFAFVILVVSLIGRCCRVRRASHIPQNMRSNTSSLFAPGTDEKSIAGKIAKKLDESTKQNKRYVWSLIGDKLSAGDQTTSNDDSTQVNQTGHVNDSSQTAELMRALLIKSLATSLGEIEADAIDAQTMVNELKSLRARPDKSQEGTAKGVGTDATVTQSEASSTSSTPDSTDRKQDGGDTKDDPVTKPQDESDASLQQELHKLQEQIESMTTELAAARDDVTKKQQSIDDLQAETAKASTDLTAAQNNVTSLQKEIDAAHVKMENLSLERDALKISDAGNARQVRDLLDSLKQMKEAREAAEAESDRLRQQLTTADTSTDTADLRKQLTAKSEELNATQDQLQTRTKERDDKQAELAQLKQEAEELRAANATAQADRTDQTAEAEQVRELSAELTKQYDALAGVLQALNQQSGSDPDYAAQLKILDQNFPGLASEPDQ